MTTISVSAAEPRHQFSLEVSASQVEGLFHVRVFGPNRSAPFHGYYKEVTHSELLRAIEDGVEYVRSYIQREKLAMLVVDAFLEDGAEEDSDD